MKNKAFDLFDLAIEVTLDFRPSSSLLMKLSSSALVRLSLKLDAENRHSFKYLNLIFCEIIW